VDLYAPLLYHGARSAGLQDQHAADLVQEVFALLLRKLPEFHYHSRKSFHG
jgi:RNA polymerase sigma-70 factor (ECF subfamily)